MPLMKPIRRLLCGGWIHNLNTLSVLDLPAALFMHTSTSSTSECTSACGGGGWPVPEGAGAEVACVGCCLAVWDAHVARTDSFTNHPNSARLMHNVAMVASIGTHDASLFCALPCNLIVRMAHAVWHTHMPVIVSHVQGQQ